jgi:hypothetical protein
MMTIGDKMGRGIKNAEKLMTSYVNDPLYIYLTKAVKCQPEKSSINLACALMLGSPGGLVKL